MKPLLYLILFLSVGACIDPLALDGTGNSRLLVVNGRITDQPGPYTVQVFYTQPVNRLVKSDTATGATVTITDDDGISETLTEKSAGVYVTSLLQGVVGKTYTLKIVLEDGTEYESAPEKMEPVGSFSNLRFEFYSSPRDSDPVGFNIFLDSKLLKEQEGRALWRWSGVFEFETNPEAHGHLEGTSIFIFEPRACSGYITDGFGLIYVRPCTCCTCYHTFHNLKPIISDPRLGIDGALKNVPLGFVEANGVYFEKKVWLTVEQQSVSASVHNFWEQVVASSNRGSDLFQTPPPATRGNISVVTKHGLGVIGIFSASAVRTDSLVIHKSDIKGELPFVPQFSDDCRSYYFTETTLTRPAYYH